MQKDELLALAERVERLTGPCRETDAEIYCQRYAFPNIMALEPSGSVAAVVLTFTASIDAAMTLVPEGLDWSAYNKGQAVVWPRDDALCGHWANAATPALALTAAALRAIAEGTNHE